MDPKTIEMNNLRVLNDYLNQTIDALGRSQRAGAMPFAQPAQNAAWNGTIPFNACMGGLSADALNNGFQQFGSCGVPGAVGQAAVGLPGQAWFGAPSPMGSAPFWPAFAGGVDPYMAQRGSSGMQQQGIGFWPQQQSIGLWPQQQSGFWPQQQGIGFWPQQQSGFWPQQQGIGFWPQQQGIGVGPQQQGGGFWPQQQGIGSWLQAGQPATEFAARQAQLTQALCAKQLVLEAMCRAAGVSI